MANGLQCKTRTNYTVSLCNHVLMLLTGAPEERRRFLLLSIISLKRTSFFFLFENILILHT